MINNYILLRFIRVIYIKNRIIMRYLFRLALILSIYCKNDHYLISFIFTILLALSSLLKLDSICILYLEYLIGVKKYDVML